MINNFIKMTLDMKKFKFRWLLMAMAVMALPFAFTSCSSDDDDNGGGTLETPKYESEAAKYEITSSDAEYSSIELTASGNYIIVKNPSTGGARALTGRSAKTSASQHVSLFRSVKKSVASRAGEWGSGILYGTYTKTADNEYKLSNLGTLKVTVKDGVACSLNLVYSDGTTKTYDGNKGVAKNNTSDFTNFICRTWNIAQIRVYYKENGQTLFDITANSWTELGQKIKEIAKNNPDEDFDESDFYETNPPKQIVITKNNTYMVLYEDNELAIANWKWLDESKGLFRYSWDEEGSYDEDTGVVTVTRKGNNLVVFEEQTETDPEDGETETFGMEYTLTEAK